ncbi:hypothetical protein DICPUDRAFT_45627 [Dictyostelium purpureum]|uniref:Profilin n=1 Tax=Dictyostelium purpureum TaxID=5786 RepID=F0ZB59_DICPU|nr:uncharacterized protein DICPUDRAFT_45627 [Dictyostelium purpureum]EGC38863.1 hypothetical protein DICPUDRAFT_45627 [Dictyostelium purpureum]|eukprot:XP_003284657.1 hypothetical protein DICPUDRAFT_45627 [Dictyostelium purpureum]
MIERKDKFYKEFLENNLFYATIILNLNGASIAYNKSPQMGEADQIIKGFKNIKKWNTIQLMGEQYNIYIRENNRVYGQNEKHGCIVVKTKKAYIIGVYIKKLELLPRVSYMEKFCKTYEEEDIIKADEKEKFVF